MTSKSDIWNYFEKYMEYGFGKLGVNIIKDSFPSLREVEWVI